ncbi:MAG: hypothetical protein KatS3mg115_0209 [Candidatus Poribacteria bacterium]|nr:MAG: hypothetical protein KatS3mg115_0209 [Candidatus Poribacteria bacterium]
MARYVRFLDENGVPVWGVVESESAEGVSGTLLRPLPPEHDPSYYGQLLEAFQEGGRGPSFYTERANILPPVGRPPLILAIGMNYQDHLDEINAKNREEGKPLVPQPMEPTVFVKFPNSVIGPEDPIVLPHMAPYQVDYEAELAAVLGRQVRNATPAEALEAVAFYTCGHDVSARDAQLQGPSGQWVRGKSFDTFCPLGPYAVTEIDPGKLNIQCRLNGETRQSSNTRHLIFDVAYLIAYLSHNTTLYPGTVLLTGTPGGVGHFSEPPVHLKPGDVVEVIIEGIGTLRNPVVADEYTGWTPQSQFTAPPVEASSQEG